MVVQHALETFYRWYRHYQLRKTAQVVTTRSDKKEPLVFSLHLGLIIFKLLPLVCLPPASSN